MENIILNDTFKRNRRFEESVVYHVKEIKFEYIDRIKTKLCKKK